MATGSEVLFDGACLRATLFQPAGAPNGGLFVTFGHFRDDQSGFEPARPVAHALRGGWASLRLQTRRNDWFINRDTLALCDRLMRLAAGFDHRAALGFSMGGYAAMRFSVPLALDHAVLVSPQFSIDPGRVPFDPRYRAEAAGFDPELGDVDTHGPANLTGLVLFDPFQTLDRRHAAMISARFPGLLPCRLGFAGHPATRVLREAGLFGAFRGQLLDSAATRASVTGLHRRARALSPAYWRAMAVRADASGRSALARQARQRAAALAPESA
jgi:hypothetical protein